MREWRSMSPYRWLLFDADNTLFDFDRAESEALRRTFDQHGIDVDDAYLPVYHRVNGQMWQLLEAGEITPAVLRSRRFELLFEELGIDADARAFGERYLPNLAQQPHLIEDALSVVRSLSAAYRLAIITNGLGDVQRPRFDRSAIRDHIAEIVISDEVGSAKPDPAIFDVAFGRMGFPARNEVLLIGDSLRSDIAGGIGYGIDTAWFNPLGLPGDGRFAPTYELRRLRELLDLL
jgi:2-haloacid dehalogenase